MKTLRVCLSSELPDILSRSRDFIYFAYDKLILYAGQNAITENFAIVSSMPEDPVVGMIYIFDTDGSVHRYINYSDTTIAKIENSSQINLLKKAGTMYYVNVNRRYLDSQRRTLTLPFNDGTYELAVSMKNNQMFTNDTIMKYNTEHERFEIYGPMDEDFIDFSKPFRGAKTDTLNINVDGPVIRGFVRISNTANNRIKAASDGLYVYLGDKLDSETFAKWSQDVADYKKYCSAVLDKIEAELDNLESIASEEVITEEIMSILRTKYEDIDTAIANYQDVVDSLNRIETTVLSYASELVAQTRNELRSELDENASWEDLDDGADFVPEVDYYNIAEEYLYPNDELSEEELTTLLINAAVIAYIAEENNE